MQLTLLPSSTNLSTLIRKILIKTLRETATRLEEKSLAITSSKIYDMIITNHISAILKSILLLLTVKSQNKDNNHSQDFSRKEIQE